MLTDRYEYRPDVLDELARHGLSPRSCTPPQVLRDAVLDLYKYEIKRLKERLISGRIPKPAYAAHVVELRKRYPILSLPLERWIAPGARSTDDRIAR